MKAYIYIILIFILTACGQSNSSDSKVISNADSTNVSAELSKPDTSNTTDANNQTKLDSDNVSGKLLGIWVLQKGAENKTEYSIREKGGKLILKTKAFMPNYDPFSTESELVKLKGKYVREDENIPKPPYLFEIKNGNLVIHDQFGVYADLKNEMKK